MIRGASLTLRRMNTLCANECPGFQEIRVRFFRKTASINYGSKKNFTEDNNVILSGPPPKLVLKGSKELTRDRSRLK